MKRLGVLLLLLDEKLVHSRLPPSISSGFPDAGFAGTHLYSGVERGSARVKCGLAQEYNTTTRPGLEPGPFDLESSALPIWPLCLPQDEIKNKEKIIKEDSKMMSLFYNYVSFPVQPKTD